LFDRVLGGGKGEVGTRKAEGRREEWVAVMQHYLSSLVQKCMELIPYDVLPCKCSSHNLQIHCKSYIL